VADLLPVAALLGLGRLREAASADIEQPAMIEATQAAILDAAIGEIDAAMRAINSTRSSDITRIASGLSAMSRLSATGCQ
jgi:hypothetical protein